MSYDYRANSKLFTHWDFLEDDFHRVCLVMIFTVPTVHFFVQETIQALNVKNPLDHHSEAKFLRSFEYMGAGSGGRGQGRIACAHQNLGHVQRKQCLQSWSVLVNCLDHKWAKSTVDINHNHLQLVQLPNSWNLGHEVEQTPG